MAPGSTFLGALDRDDETPGDTDYTSVYSLTDEFVQPAAPEPTAALASGEDPDVANVLVQELCPWRPVEHGGFAYDAVVHEVAMDALTTDGPFSGELDPRACLQGSFGGVDLVEGAEIVRSSLQSGEFDPPEDFHHAREEPELACYAKDPPECEGSS